MAAAYAGGERLMRSHSTGMVDAAVHVGSPDTARYPRSPDFQHTPLVSASIEEFESIASRYGVRQAVVVQPSMYGFDHTYLCACLAGRQADLAGVALLDPEAAANADQLEALYTADVVRGLRLGLNYDDGRDWLGPGAGPLIDKATELGVVVSIFMAPRHLPQVERWLEHHPRTTVVVDHLGRPDLSDGDPLQAVRSLGGLARFPRLYLKVSALPALSQEPFPYRDTWDWVKEAVEHFGVERLMWGSDFPLSARADAYGRSLEAFISSTAWLGADGTDRVLGDTARAVYGLPTGDLPCGR